MFENTNMVVMKLTRDCNLRCKYCYIKNKDNYKGELMKFDVFKQLIMNIVKDKTLSGNKTGIELVLHGGEPTLVPASQLRKFLSYAKRTFDMNNISCKFSIQTNATLLNDEMLSVLHDFKIPVGLSFDGIGDSNTLRTEKGSDFYKDVVEKLNKYNIRAGFLSVISPTNIDNVYDNLKYIQKELGAREAKFNYAEDTQNVGGCEVSGKDFFEKVYRLLFQKAIEDKTSIGESNLRRVLDRYFNWRIGEHTVDSNGGNCWIKFCGGGNSIIELNPDGSLNFCGRYSEDFEDARLGTLFDKDILSLHSIGQYFKTVRAKDSFIRELGCDLCPADSICDHGCIAFHRSKYGKWGVRKELVCDMYKPLYQYIIQNEKELFSVLFRSYESFGDTRMFFRMSSPKDKNIISYISHVVGEEYTVGIDNEFKPNGEKNTSDKVYQVVVKRKNELHNNEKLQ